MKLKDAPPTRGIKDPVLASFTKGTLRHEDADHVNRPTVCDRSFAKTVLTVLEEWAAKYDFAYVEHSGVWRYLWIPRNKDEALEWQSRGENEPRLRRVSKHASGRAINLTSVVAADSPLKHISIKTLMSDAPEKVKQLKEMLKEHSIKWARNHDGRWIHIGLKKRKKRR